MAFRGVLNFLLLFYMAVCAKASVRGMISGSFGRGRADVLYNGEWGSIGNTGWDHADATVFCRSLGFSSGTAIPSSELYNRRRTIWLDNVNCTGTENSLDQCPHLGWGETTVDPNKPASAIIAGVQCFGDLVRISGGKTQGRAEKFHDGKWGSVAADYWDDNDAKVFCSMLGFRTGKATRLPAVPVVSKDVHCTGHETTIDHCPNQDSSNDVCNCAEDVAGVECVGEKVRISGGWKKGRAEIFYDDKWGTICDSPGNNDAATVFCRMLGFWTGRYPSQVKTMASPETPIWVQEFFCTGNESTLAQCGYRNFKNTTCTHEEDIEVSCSNVQARISSSHNLVGRAELFFDGQWLPICAHTMTKKVARIFCKTLGLRLGETFPLNLPHGDTLHLAHVNCNGEEDSIQQCTDITWNTRGCGGDLDAFIKCSGNIAVRGPQNEVIVYHGPASASVCTDNWDNSDATVYCRMLGYREGTASSVLSPGNTTDFQITNVDCLGHEFHLLQCTYESLTNESCGNNQVATANCTGDLVRIVGESVNKGRAEIFYNGQWGTICSNYWDDKSSKVFLSNARIQWFPNGAARLIGVVEEDNRNGVVFDPYDANIPENTGPVWLSDVTCTGGESNILQCGHTDWEDHQCIHEYDIGVECS